jgi:predicted dithiol-disulfide oxidoreductase (DUF899 family)
MKKRKSAQSKALPKIVSERKWQKAHEKLLKKEKAATHARDALAAERRRQPMVEIEKEHSPDRTAKRACSICSKGGDN